MVPARLRGKCITGKTRLVMVFDGLCQRFTQPVMAGIVAAHDALQLGKLADHVRQQIGLGQAGGGVDLPEDRGITECHCDAVCDGAHPLHALTLGPELVVVDHLVQTGDPRLQRGAPVLVEEELGICQARAHHPFVATPSQHLHRPARYC
jgi:hypothetical protein